MCTVCTRPFLLPQRSWGRFVCIQGNELTTVTVSSQSLWHHWLIRSWSMAIICWPSYYLLVLRISSSGSPHGHHRPFITLPCHATRTTPSNPMPTIHFYVASTYVDTNRKDNDTSYLRSTFRVATQNDSGQQHGMEKRHMVRRSRDWV